VTSACVDSRAPVAVLAKPSAPEAFALVELDGTASSHPDAPYGGRIDAFHWTIESLDGACDPPAVTGTQAVARVRFACAGVFRVVLVAVDDLGKRSPPASADVTVLLRPQGPVETSPDQTVNHVCSGSPLTCTTSGGPVSVSAGIRPGVKTTGAVVFAWSAATPDGSPPDEHRSVSFRPSAEVANPSVQIQVDGTAVASMVDDWVLRVVARDEAGPIGEATTRVSVLNRPPVPVLAVSAVAVGHTYSLGAYRASALATRWQDPDGDPIATATGSTGDAVCSSWRLQADQTAVVDCVQAFHGNPDELARFAGTRTVSLLVRDPWQTADPQGTAITIRNNAVSASSSTFTGCQLGSRLIEGECCSWSSEPGLPRWCTLGSWHCGAVPLNPALDDPDGDPMRVTWLGGGFDAKTVVCEPGTCAATATPAIASYLGCSRPTGSRVGDYTATDGLTTGTGTLTFRY
jgi:hypothetical protein